MTAVIGAADATRGDRVVLSLDSGGGTVTGYGLGASQLQRLRDAGLHLTVCIDEVACSGGYMMACVADEIVAAPFASLGSIGVVTTVPNISERLKREGVQVDEITSGKFKRTLTPFKTTRAEDREKVQSELNDMMKIFKSHVAHYRPHLNIDELATGEVWPALEGISRGLCDKLGTVDDLILQLIRSGADVYSGDHVRLCH